MPELATAWVTLAVRAAGMRSDVQRVFNQIDGARAGRRVGEQFSRGVAANTNLTPVERKIAEVGRAGAAAMGKAMKVGAVTAAAGVTAALGTALTLGLNRLTAIDDARGKLTALGHDAQGTAQIMDSALSSVKGTAYGLGDAATIAASAVAAGVKPGKELTSYLKLTADAAAVAGTSLSDMGLILNQVRTGRTAYTDDLNQLAGRGLPIYQWIAKEMGVAPELVKKMAGKAKISSEVFEAAIRNNISGAALDMGKTVKGAAENVKAAMSRAGAAALQPGFTRLPGTLSAITVAVDNATPKITELAQAFDRRVFNDWIPGAERAWHALAGNEAVRSNVGELRALLASLGSTAKGLGPSLGQIATSLGRASASLGVSSWRLLVTALEAAAGALNTVAPLASGVANFMSSHQGVVTAAAAAWLAFRTVPAILGRITPATTAAGQAVSSFGQKLRAAGTGVKDFGGAYRQSVKWMQQANPTASTAGRVLFGMGPQAATASAHLRVLGANARAAATGGLNMLKSAGAGVVGALGGPFSAALMAAGVAMTVVMAKNQQASQSMQAYRDAVDRTKNAQAGLNEALMNSRGAFDETVKGTAVTRIKAIGDEFEAAGKRTGSFMDQFRSRNGGAGEASAWLTVMSGGAGMLASKLGVFGDSKDDKIKAQADAANRANEAFKQLGITQEKLTDITYGSQGAFDALVGQLDQTGSAGKKYADQLREARKEFQQQQETARTVVPGIKQMSDAMRILGDSTASAADKTRALTLALDMLNPERSAAAAESAHTQAMQRIAESAKEAADAAGGLGAALLKADGGINTNLPNGAELSQTLDSIVKSTEAVATSGGDMGAAVARANAQFDALGKKFGLLPQQIKDAANQLGWQNLLDIKIAADDHEAIQALTAVQEAARKATAEKHDLILDSTTVAPLKKLLESVYEIKGDITKPGGTVTLIPKTDDAQNKLAQLKTLLDSIQDKAVNVRINQIATTQGIPQDVVNNSWWAPPAKPRLLGAIVPMEDGGLRYIRKPDTAGLYAGRGLGTIFAEKQTGGEAYIPLAPGKRKRSAAILSEVARLFGMTVMEDGGISLEGFKRFAAQIAGHRYVRGGGNGDSFDTDCSGAQATLVNALTGAAGRFSTGNEAAALLARGFQMGDPPAGVAAYWVGWRNGGPGGGHWPNRSSRTSRAWTTARRCRPGSSSTACCSPRIGGSPANG
ncbi:tape measure protein, partial [Mycolicibacterium insubricum]|uniref:tape measure protein n=1 Tax=Mycolicibacterium insubricum TaxID=444597 RepID=UPI0021F341C6